MTARKIYGAGLTRQPAGVHLDVKLYAGNRRIALCLTAADCGMPYGKLTVNVPQVALADDEIVVAGGILPTDLKAHFLASGLFEAARHIPDGAGRAEVWRIVSAELLSAAAMLRAQPPAERQWLAAA